MKPWKRIEPTIVSKVGFRSIVSKNYQLPDGRQHHFETVWPEGTHLAAVIALTPDNQVIIARQFRPGPEEIFDELPGGIVEPGEDIAHAVARELQEEVGYIPGDMIEIGFSYKDSGSNGKYHYFLATNCTPHYQGQNTDDVEHVEVVLISIDQLLENGHSGRMSDIEALFFAHDKLMQIREGIYDKS